MSYSWVSARLDAFTLSRELGPQRFFQRSREWVSQKIWQNIHIIKTTPFNKENRLRHSSCIFFTSGKRIGASLGITCVKPMFEFEPKNFLEVGARTPTIKLASKTTWTCCPHKWSGANFPLDTQGPVEGSRWLPWWMKLVSSLSPFTIENKGKNKSAKNYHVPWNDSFWASAEKI